ncbi:MAG: hypothetical protein JO219_12135 [Candidatus Eremiobacteraeota bacterium]|nr:hypothetical protein [Candidatus Eremiobacteraeota bacterium]MBV8366263.1 hypothetical protein [Candidatus Eremiobacteraeota bacterium]
MQRGWRTLYFALAAGVTAVVAAAIPLLATGAPPTQLTWTKTTTTKMAGPAAMFFHPKAQNETTIIGPQRMRTDNDTTTQILQCDTKRIINADNGKKTYWVMTFDQYKAAMAASVAKAEQEMKQYSPPPNQPNPSGSPIQGSGGVTISVNTVNDPNTRQIFGMTAHHVTETITGTSNGTGQCPNGEIGTMTNDEWYVANPVTITCNLPKPPAPPPMPQMPGGGGHGQANPCLGTFQVQATGKAHSTDRFALIQDTTMVLGLKFTIHEEVTQFENQQYNPASFDPPAGYTQVPPPADFTSGR